MPSGPSSSAAASVAGSQAERTTVAGQPGPAQPLAVVEDRVARPRAPPRSAPRPARPSSVRTSSGQLAARQDQRDVALVPVHEQAVGRGQPTEGRVAERPGRSAPPGPGSRPTDGTPPRTPPAPAARSRPPASGRSAPCPPAGRRAAPRGCRTAPTCAAGSGCSSSISARLVADTSAAGNRATRATGSGSTSATRAPSSDARLAPAPLGASCGRRPGPPRSSRSSRGCSAPSRQLQRGGRAQSQPPALAGQPHDAHARRPHLDRDQRDAPAPTEALAARSRPRPARPVDCGAAAAFTAPPRTSPC